MTGIVRHCGVNEPARPAGRSSRRGKQADETGRGWCDQHALKRFGCSEKEMIGRADSELFPADVVCPINAADQQVLSTLQPYAGEESFPDVDGV